MAGTVNLTSTPTGAQESKSVLSGIQVNTSPVHVGNAEYEELTPEDTHNIEVGVFIDGTWNNRNNTEARLEYQKAQRGAPHDEALAARYINDDVASFENYFSNVARMEPHYENKVTDKLITFRLYIEGIGTEDFEKDALLGGGFGTGSSGIEEKVEKACSRIADLAKKKGVENINTLTIDVFGFSRGAAAARNLVHEVSKPFQAEKVTYTYSRGGTPIAHTLPEKPRYGHLGAALEESEIPVRMLIVRFVGIYDTVSSHGLGVIFSYDNDTQALGLDAIRKAKFTLHLTAADEHRKNFSLTNINSALESGRGKEFSLPGVHGDLGGSYNDGAIEKRRFSYHEQATIIAQGWYTASQLEPVQWDRYGANPTVIEGTRSLPNTYTHIPLSIMTDFTVTQKLPVKSVPIKNTYAIPPQLNSVKNRIDDYVFNNGVPFDFNSEADRRLLIPLRNQFLHFSAQFQSLTMGARRRFWSRERYRKINDG